MITVSVQEAKEKLEELIEKALAGETVEITFNAAKAQLCSFLVPIHDDKFAALREPKSGPRMLGAAKGQIWIADDFDEPLDDFKEYQ